MSTFSLVLTVVGAFTFLAGLFLLFFSQSVLRLWLSAQFVWSALMIFFVGALSATLSNQIVFKVAITFFCGFSIFSLFFLSLMTRAQILKKINSLEDLQELRR